MNNSAKGARKERECLEQLQAYIKEMWPESRPITAWKTYRSRAGGNDFLGDQKKGITGFDIALLYKGFIVLVQVDDEFNRKRWLNLLANWNGLSSKVICYYAIYNNRPKIFRKQEDRKTPPADDIKLPGFYLLRV